MLWGGAGRAAAHHRIDRPTSRSVEKHVKKKPAIDHRQLAAIDDRYPAGAGGFEMRHEEGDRHHAAGNKGRNARQQPNGNEDTENQLDPGTDSAKGIELLGRSAWNGEPAENL